MAVISSVTLNADGPHSGGARERERCGKREINEKEKRESKKRETRETKERERERRVKEREREVRKRESKRARNRARVRSKSGNVTAGVNTVKRTQLRRQSDIPDK